MRGYSMDVPLPSALEIVDSPWAARQAVRDQSAHGADLIKVYVAYDFSFAADGKMVVPPMLTEEEINAIVAEAHKKGRKVSCHAFGGEGLQNCIDAGVESIEHSVDLNDSEMKTMIEKGTYLVPALYHYQEDRERDMKKYAGQAWSRFLSAASRKQWSRVQKLRSGQA